MLSSRYFTNQELRDLFTLDDPYTSKTQMQLEQMHAHHRKTDEQLDKHIAFIHTLSKLRCYKVRHGRGFTNLIIILWFVYYTVSVTASAACA